MKKISLARFSARERFAKRYFPYRELRILAECFLFHRKVLLSHMKAAPSYEMKKAAASRFLGYATTFLCSLCYFA